MKFLHSDRFSFFCYLLACLVGIFAGIVGVALVGEAGEGSLVSLQSLARIPVLSVTLMLFSFPLLVIAFLIGSFAMVPVTILLIGWARRNGLVNAGVAALCGVPVSLIYMFALLFSGANSLEEDLFSLDNPLWVASIIGGLAGGLVYFALGKRSGLWTVNSETIL